MFGIDESELLIFSYWLFHLIYLRYLADANLGGEHKSKNT
jgi:hypothetical protein